MAVLSASLILSLLTVGSSPGRTAAAQPDLGVTAASTPTGSVAQGGSLTVTDSVLNAGAADADVSVTRYYLSSDQTIGLNDIRLMSLRKVEPVPAGGASTGSATVYVPVSAQPASYELLACADDLAAVDEADESNNCLPAADRVQVTPFGKAPGIYAFSNSRTLPGTETIAQRLTAKKSRLCPAGAPVTKQLDLNSAVLNAKMFLIREAGRRDFRRVARSSATKTVAGSEKLAAGAVAADSPGLALAALLRAHEQQPKNPVHLVSASVLLTNLGLPVEGLAFADGATGLADPIEAPMGISLQAATLSNRGFALIALRRYADAKTALTAAIAIDPLLAEARTNLARAELCLGDTNEAARLFSAGGRRGGEPGIVIDDCCVEVTDETTGEVQQIPIAADVFDLSQGKDITIPTIPYPLSPEAAADYFDGVYQVILKEGQDKEEEKIQRLNAVGSGVRPPPNALTKARIDDISFLLGAGALAQPELRDLWRSFDDATTQRTDYYVQWALEVNEKQTTMTPEEYAGWCPGNLESANQKWYGYQDRVESTGRPFIKALYRYSTGLAANIRDPNLHKVLSILTEMTAEGFLYHNIFGTTGGAYSWAENTATMWDDTYVDPADGQTKFSCRSGGGGSGSPPPAGASDWVEPQSDPCPPHLKAMSFELKLGGLVRIGATCESFKFGIGTTLAPLVGAFAEVEYNTKSGETTVFAGGSVGGDLPGGVFSGKAKTGVYVKFDKNGNGTDVGMRFTDEVKVGDGATVKLAGDKMDFTFVGSAKDPGIFD